MAEPSENIWLSSSVAQAPPPLFFNAQDRLFVAGVVNETTERIIGQVILYYPVAPELTNYHPLYMESFTKIVNNPIRVYALIQWSGFDTTTTSHGIDRKPSIVIHFHKRRLNEDQDVVVKEGDFVLYHETYYEITKLNEPQQIWGQQQHQMEIEAKCIKARRGAFKLYEDQP